MLFFYSSGFRISFLKYFKEAAERMYGYRRIVGPKGDYLVVSDLAIVLIN